MPEHIVEVTPLTDQRSDDPEKNHGITGAVLRWTYRGKNGRVTFAIQTNWFSDELRQQFLERGMFDLLAPYPLSATIELPGQKIVTPSKEAAALFMATLIENGSDEMWALMEQALRCAPHTSLAARALAAIRRVLNMEIAPW